LGVDSLVEFVFQFQKPDPLAGREVRSGNAHYAASAASRCAFSTASSMAPTM
jgi:hypothetical protein